MQFCEIGFFSHWRFPRLLLTSLWLLVSLAACAPGHPQMQVPGNDQPVDLRVMSFNIEWGGAKVSFDKVTEAIRLSSGYRGNPGSRR